MRTDIAARLRAFMNVLEPRDPDDLQLLAEAADEIERLRAELETVQSKLNQWEFWAASRVSAKGGK